MSNQALSDDRRENGDLEAEAERELRETAVEAGISGIRHLTQAEDIALVAQRVARLSEVVGEAGARDAMEGVEMLVASDNIEAMSAMMGLMSLGDLEQGLALARISGEMRMAGDIVARLKMPVLAGFLSSRGEALNDTAIDQVVRSSATRVMGAALAVTGSDVRNLSENEIAEGLVRLAASAALQEEAGDLAVDAVGRAVIGEAEIEAAQDLAGAAAAGSNGASDAARGTSGNAS